MTLGMRRILVFILLASAASVPVVAQAPPPDSGLIQLALVMDASHTSRYRNSKLDADVLAAATRAFTESRRFHVIERANLQAILAEKDLEDFIQRTNAGGLTDLDGVDLIGILSYDVEDRAMGTYYRISAQLTSARSGRVQHTITSDRDAFKEPTSVFIAGNHLYDNIKEKFPANGWVIETRGETVVVDLGERDGVAKGDRIEVFEFGEPIIHPVTGELLEGSEREIALLKVTDVSAQMSTCSFKTAGAVQVGNRVRIVDKSSKGKSILGKTLRRWKKNR